MMKHSKGILVVVSGFAGAGKGTIMRQLLENYDNYALSVSMTTRQPRQGERDGVEYFFSSREDFEKKIAEDGLIEYAEYCGNYYGTPRHYVEQQLLSGRDVILEIEIQGAFQVKKKFPEAVLVFVTPPGAAELKRRLVGRGTETMEVIDRRMRRAAEEAEHMGDYDYLVVNDDFRTCAEEIHRIIQASRRKPGCNEEFIEEIKAELKALSKGDN